MLFVTMFALQQIVTWITGSNVSLLTIFYLAALIAFIRYISCGRIVWYLLAFFFYVCALAVGEYAITLSLMLIGVSVLLYIETKKNNLRSFLAMLPFGLVLIPYF